MEFKRLVVGPLQTNCYILIKENQALIIDPGDEAHKIATTINALGLVPVAIFLTHGHWDHFGAAEKLKEIFSTDIYVHKDDVAYVMDPLRCTFREYEWLKELSAKPQRTFTEGSMEIGEFKFEILHTPGHSRGSSCFYFGKEKLLFSGDTLFKNAIGRTDLACSVPEKMEGSLKKIASLPRDVEVFPGHGLPTTIEEELEFNLYFQF